NGLEVGMIEAGATEATARRLRCEAAAIIASYGIVIDVKASTPRGKVMEVKRLDFRSLEAEGTWVGLVNTARQMRNASTNSKRLEQGMPQKVGRGNHAVRKFQDAKFNRLREQLIARTATTQALDLLDAGIIAVANAYAGIAPEEIDSLRE